MERVDALRRVVAGLVLASGLAGCGGGEKLQTDDVPGIDFKMLAEVRAAESEEIIPDYPPELAALHGGEVAISGFMAPFDSLEDMSRFMLMPNYVGCFFCEPPSLTQVLLVEMPPTKEGEKRPFVEPAIVVRGQLDLYLPDEDGPFDFSDGFLFTIRNARHAVATGENLPTRASAHGGLANTPGSHEGSGPPMEGGGEPPPPADPEEILAEVEQIRGMKFKQALTFRTVPPAVIRKHVEGQIAGRMDEKESVARARAAVALGLAAKHFNYREVATGLVLQRTVGFFDKEDGAICYSADLPLSNGDACVELAKLMTRALIWQHGGGEATHVPAGSQDDAWMMREAVLMGEAQRVGAQYARRRFMGVPPVDSPFFYYPEYGEPPEFLEALLSSPLLLGDYLAEDVFADGGWEDYARLKEAPPASSAELMLGKPWSEEARFEPTSVEIPDATLGGCDPVFTNVLGQAGMTIWISQWAGIEESQQGASGWRGDRYLVWDGGGKGDSVYLRTHWKDAAAAERFYRTLRERPQNLAGEAGQDGGLPGDAWRCSAPWDEHVLVLVRERDKPVVHVIRAVDAKVAEEIERKFAGAEQAR